MAHEDIVRKIIDRVPAFHDLTFRQAHKLLEAGEVKSFAKGEQLCCEGDDSTEIFVLLSGELSIKSGDVELSRITSSDIVGEMSSLTGLPRSATVEAEVDATALVVRKDEFEELLGSNPTLASRVYKNMLVSLCQKLRDANVKIVHTPADGGKTATWVV